MVAVVLYIASIFAANAAIVHFGVVPVGFGLMAPAGVFAVGATLALRDWVHERRGRWWALAAVLVGAGLSALLDPSLAVASGAAFLLSELFDLGVYVQLRRRGLALAVAASGAVGLVVDSALFLSLAFGSLEFLPGQVVGKAYMTAAAVVLVALVRRSPNSPPRGTASTSPAVAR